MCTVVCSVIGIVYFLIAWGLWTLKPWARTIALVFAVIRVLNVPFGTIINIIISLRKPETRAAFVA